MPFISQIQPDTSVATDALPTRRYGTFGLGVVLFSLLSTSCVEHLGEESSAVGKLERDCVVPVPAGVVQLTAPTALEYPDETLFIWPMLALTDDSIVPNAVAHASDAATLCSNGPELVLDENDQPRSILPLSAAEQDENSARDDGRHLELVPVGGLVHDGVGYLFYEPTLFGPGFFDSEKLGTGLCVLDGGDDCERVTLDGSTILFPPTARALNQGGFVDHGRALVYGCTHAASFSDPCTLSSAPVDELTDPTAYRIYNEFDGWLTKPTDATILFDRPGALTVSPFDGKFAAVTLDIYSSRFELQVAPAPTGHFEPPHELFQAVTPDGLFPSGGKEHSGLRGESRTLHVSYFTDRAGSEYGLHLASFQVFGRPR